MKKDTYTCILSDVRTYDFDTFWWCSAPRWWWWWWWWWWLWLWLNLLLFLLLLLLLSLLLLSLSSLLLTLSSLLSSSLLFFFSSSYHVLLLFSFLWFSHHSHFYSCFASAKLCVGTHLARLRCATHQLGLLRIYLGNVGISTRIWMRIWGYFHDKNRACKPWSFFFWWCSPEFFREIVLFWCQWWTLRDAKIHGFNFLVQLWLLDGWDLEVFQVMKVALFIIHLIFEFSDFPMK